MAAAAAVVAAISVLSLATKNGSKIRILIETR